MSEGKGQRKWPIPAGFEFNFEAGDYQHTDGRHWDSDTNEFWNPKTREYMPGTEINVPAESVEDEIQRKNLTAPRVTPADINAAIIKEEFQVFANSTLTVCVLTLRNGFTVTGESACASPENFNAELGRRIARDKAKDKIWPLLGYALRDRLHNWEQQK